MDLKALATLSQKHRKESTKDTQARYKDADHLYYLGLMALQMAQKTGFQDKALALEASNYLISSLQLNRSNTEPYVALGYLMLAYGRNSRAARYLREALERQPDHEEAQRLISLARGQNYPTKQYSDIGDLISSLQNKSGSTFEVYQGVKTVESLFRRLKNHLDELNGKLQKTRPGSDVDQLERIEAQLNELSDLEQMVDLGLQQVKDPIQKSRLQLCLGSITQTKRRFGQILGVIEALVDLHDAIDILLEKAENLLDHLNGGQQIETERLTKTLDQWFFRCDRFADQIERYDGQNYQMQGILKDYELLASALESLDAYVSA